MFFTPIMHFFTPDPMLSGDVHRTVNVAFLCQCSIALLYCLWARRILPTYRGHPTVNSIFVKQFRWMLMIHGTFYGAEILLTDMAGGFKPMAIHHIVGAYFSCLFWQCIDSQMWPPGCFLFSALVIFAAMVVEPQGICVVSLLPFFLHAFFWVYSFGESLFLLALYNVSLLAAGLAFAICRVIQQDNPSITWWIPSFTLIEVSVNYFTYCWSYWGTYCPRVRKQTWAEGLRLVSVSILLVAFIAIPAVRVAQKMARR
ncbi:hypothetical protein BC832DRAFT_558581 [Gaertneriomyces semiglobifer]|nr:hypothetical protein BC832DRAFT_558581 [Gaertneriomyces semiglobifer]